VARSGAGARPWLDGPIATIAAIALIAGLATPARALTGGAPTPSGSAPPPPSRSGSPDPSPSAGALRLLAATTWPHKSFYYGTRPTRLRYEIGSEQASNDLRIDVVAANGEVMRSFFRNDVAPDTPDRVRWDGTAGGGRPARNGHYSFRIVPQSGGGAARASATAQRPLSLGFDLYGYAFPILGSHYYGGAGGRFGAGRGGHSHEGQDVMARCGIPLIAARGGRVQYSGYQGAAGNYIVIDGKGTGFDTAYMHLLGPSPLKAGMTVRTGQPIGLVGQTGDASACHLHFEFWTAPGWYEGGSPVDPLGYLKRWDAYS
jgi:murein DD-endopeptidase MepM/ murein hydrolase activator NlpD